MGWPGWSPSSCTLFYSLQKVHEDACNKLTLALLLNSKYSQSMNESVDQVFVEKPLESSMVLNTSGQSRETLPTARPSAAKEPTVQLVPIGLTTAVVSPSSITHLSVWNPLMNTHLGVKMPFSNTGNQGSLGKWLIPGARQRKHKMDLDHLVIPERK